MLALGVMVCPMLAACKAKEQPAPPEAPPPAVTVALPVEYEVTEWDEYTGYLDAVEFVEVRARVSGLVVAVPFEEGALVRQGDLLVEIDSRPFKAALDARLAEQARAEAQVELALVEFNRIQGLPAGAASNIERETVAAQLDQARAVLAGAKAAVEAARLNVEWCRVEAPIAGRISRRLVTPGNLITGGGGEGTLLTSIASIDPIYCYIDADEQSVLKYQRLVREGKRASAREKVVPCFLQLANETGFPHEGVIDFVDNRLDPRTGTMRARGVFPNPEGWLVPGLFARMRVPGRGPYRAILVPDAAVSRDQNQKRLLVVGPDDVVEARTVELGALFGNLRAVESGITADDRVIINGLLHARPGARVAALPGSFDTDALARLAVTPQPATAPATASPATAVGAAGIRP